MKVLSPLFSLLFCFCFDVLLLSRLMHMFCVIGTEDYRNSVISFNRCQRFTKTRLVFIDAVEYELNLEQTGLAPSGQTPKTIAEKAEKYEPRVDIMGAISYNGPLACETKTSKHRKAIPNPRKKGKVGVKGYAKGMVKDFLKDQVAPKIKAMKVKKVIACIDKGLAFKEEEAKEQFRLGGAKNLADVWIMSTNIAKHVSPLDNTL